MPQAVIGPAIALGSSALGAGGGKKAAKKQSKAAEAQLAQLQPLIQAIIGATQTSVAEGQNQVGRGAKFSDKSSPFFFRNLQNQEDATYDLKNFYRPLATGNRAAIDAFLSPERRAINEGYSGLQNNIARFAPRGGGRVAAGINADVQRQGQLSDLVFNARRTGAEGLGNVANLYGNISQGGRSGVETGFGAIGQGLGAIGQGASGAGNLFGMLTNSQNRAADLAGQSAMGLGDLGRNLGGLLGSLFGGNRSRDRGIGTYSPGGYTDLGGIFRPS